MLHYAHTFFAWRRDLASEQEIRDRRHRRIAAILRRGSLRRQEDLVARLAEEGFEVTQSSVSRDLRELGVAKVAGRYLVPAPTGAQSSVADVAHLLRAARAA